MRHEGVEFKLIRNLRKALLEFDSHIRGGLFLLFGAGEILNDVCLWQMMLAPPMMTASPNDVRYANDVCLRAHRGKHRIIATKGSNIILSKAKNIISPQAMHHLKYIRLDLFIKV